jgi:hypothetical protein
MRMKRSLLLPAALLALSGASHAQAPLSPATPPAQTAPPAPAASSECAPRPRGTVAPRGATTGQTTEPLGDRLARSNGVLCPPSGIDPEMRAPTPDAGKMPVIPPPGSPGGNPNMQPK